MGKRISTHILQAISISFKGYVFEPEPLRNISGPVSHPPSHYFSMFSHVILMFFSHVALIVCQMAAHCSLQHTREESLVPSHPYEICSRGFMDYWTYGASHLLLWTALSLLIPFSPNSF